jgi:hypothetical protein
MNQWIHAAARRYQQQQQNLMINDRLNEDVELETYEMNAWNVSSDAVDKQSCRASFHS